MKYFDYRQIIKCLVQTGIALALRKEIEQVNLSKPERFLWIQ